MRTATIGHSVTTNNCWRERSATLQHHATLGPNSGLAERAANRLRGNLLQTATTHNNLLIFLHLFYNLP
jgi:hypothetical protein